MCFYRTKLYKACGHTEFRRFMCNTTPTNNDSHQSNLESDGNVHIKNPFACGELPQHVNDVELGICGHCRKGRNKNKRMGWGRTALDEEQSRKEPRIRLFVSDPCSDEPQHGEESHGQSRIGIFLPESEVKETKPAKTEDIDAVSADALEEWLLIKGGIEETLKGCHQSFEENQPTQTEISTLVKALTSHSEYRPMTITNKTKHPARRIEGESPAQSQHVEQAATPPLPSHSSTSPLSHSATKVRRGLFEARGRVRSMIEAINTKSDASQMIRPINHRSMVTTIVNTINRTRQPDHSAKSQPPVDPGKELTKRPLPLPPYPDIRALSKPAKLELLAKHRYHRLVPVPEESASQSLVLANSLPSTVVLRRAKAIKVRNLNAFHCPVMKPRFGLKRKVLAPPVPRHSTPPVAVPFSKFADLGRRRVSEAEWCFVF